MLKQRFIGCAVVLGMISASAVKGQTPAAPAYPTAQQMADSKEAQQHLEKALALAKPDLLTEEQNVCSPTGPQRPAALRAAAGQAAVLHALVEPTRIFDNLYYIGFDDVGAFAMKTSAGILLVDTLNTPQEAEEVLAGRLVKVGLNPADVKYILIGHGHYDHFGGASYFQDKYRPRVAMSGADWNLIETPNTFQSDRARPKRDVVVKDGQKVTLGDTTLTVMLTPGHTPGTLAILIPVKDKGKPYTALLLSGGTATPTPASLAAFEKALNTAKQAHAAVMLLGHPGVFEDDLGWMAAIRKNPSGPNPFIYGEARFARYLDIMSECAQARMAALGYGRPAASAAR
jgi:metallo-beta-lactamase class B